MKNKVKNQAAVSLGKLSGAINKKKGSKYFSDLAKKRWVPVDKKV